MIPAAALIPKTTCAATSAEGMAGGISAYQRRSGARRIRYPVGTLNGVRLNGSRRN